MELYKQEGSKYWTADFFVHGRRVRKSTKETTRSKAMEVGMRMRIRLSGERNRGAPLPFPLSKSL